MKKLLLILAVLIVLPLQLSYGFEVFSKANFGTYNAYGEKSEFALSVGGNGVWVTQEETRTRVMQYVGFFQAHMSDEIQGLTSFLQIEKYLNLSSGVQPYILFGGGGLWQIKDAEDLLQLDLKFEFGTHLFDWISVGFGVDYIPMEGPNASFTYLSLNLIPSL